MKLYIKNMVCGRCEMAVRATLEQLQIPIISIQLGEVELSGNLEESLKQTLAKNLNALGFELLDDKISKTIERIKNLIIDLVHYQNEKLKINLSTYLAEDLKQDYSTLSNLFSETEGITYTSLAFKTSYTCLPFINPVKWKRSEILRAAAKRII